MYQSENEEEKPQWVEDEIEHFTKQRDKDGDGFLDENEVSIVHSLFHITDLLY